MLIPTSTNTPGLRAARDKTTKCWQALLKCVLRGAFKDVFKLSKPFKSSAAAAFNDRFTLSVQLGSSTVDWTLLLDGMRPERPPDIIFDEHSQSFSTHVQYAELNAIKTWDIRRESALEGLLVEIRTEFLKYHHARVLEFSDNLVKFEVESVIALAPQAQLRFLPDKQMAVECVVPIYYSTEVGGEEGAAAAGAGFGGGSTDVSHGRGGAVQREACRLILVIQSEKKHFQAWLDYPASTPPDQRSACPPWQPGVHLFDFIPSVQALVQSRIAVRRVREVINLNPKP